MYSPGVIGVIILIIGIVVLVYSANKIVDAAIHCMHLYSLSATVVGVLIIALGTSMPEIFVSLIASLRGNSGIAYGEILGSNTANIPLVFGFALIIGNGVTIKDHFIAKRDAIFLCAATVIAGILMSDLLISRADGFVLICLFAIYVYTVHITDHHRTESLKFGKSFFHRLINKLEAHSIASQKRHTFVQLILSAFGLFIGALLTVRGAEILIVSMGLSPVFIALVAIAIGTTLPEVAASIAAVRKGEDEMGIANVVGDNISSILLALGLAAIARPIPVEASSLVIDLPAVLLITFLFTLVLLWRETLPKWIGYAFLILYIVILVLYVEFH